jgi:hypothetical protein
MTTAQRKDTLNPARLERWSYQIGSGSSIHGLSFPHLFVIGLLDYSVV